MWARRWMASLPSKLPQTRSTMEHKMAPYFASKELDVVPDFALARNNGQLLLASTPTTTLFRSAFVLWACSKPLIVKHSRNLLACSRAVLGDRITQAAVRWSIFAQFVGGESADAIEPVVRKLASQNVHAILDFAAEEDLGKAEAFSEEKCDRNVKLFLESIESAAKLRQADLCVALKVTALGRPSLLAHVTNVLRDVRKLFLELFSNQEKEQEHAITYSQFYRGLEHLQIGFTEERAKRLFDRFDRDKDGAIDLLDWMEYLSPHDLQTRPFFVALSAKSKLPTMGKEDINAMLRLMTRLYTVADYAAKNKVKLLVDAEHTYFQHAIDHLVMNLQRKYNRTGPIVYNTYQSYLVDCYDRLLLDMKRARNEGFAFGVKLVRGAYMVEERARAKRLQYADPIHKDLPTTHKSFNACLEAMLQEGDNGSLVLGSHNEASLQHAVNRMQQLKISRSRVLFAQLLGMSDYLTFTLSEHGYSVYKYLPYGPIDAVVPYLLRRAEENVEIGSGVEIDRLMIRREIRRRLFGTK